MLSFNMALVIKHYVWFAFLFVQTVYLSNERAKAILSGGSEVCFNLCSINIINNKYNIDDKIQ